MKMTAALRMGLRILMMMEMERSPGCTMTLRRTSERMGPGITGPSRWMLINVTLASSYHIFLV